MEINGVSEVANTGRRVGFSVPSFLRKVLTKELGNSDSFDHKLLVVAVHAVLQESGFIESDGFSLSDLSLSYTLPEIIQNSGVGQNVTLMIQSLGGKEVKFYGSLAQTRSRFYSMCIDEERLVIVLNLMWANIDTGVEKNGLIIHTAKEVLEFWKTVKDKLALPLLIDLCDVSNLPPPSCFACLPKDLKLRILELLPADEMAKMACVSQDFRTLLSNDDVWKRKYFEQFGNIVQKSWKQEFVKAWEVEARKTKSRWDRTFRYLFSQ